MPANHIKSLYSHLTSHWRKYLLIILLLIFLILVLGKFEKAFERYSEKWAKMYLKTHIKLDITWDKWEWDLISSHLIVTGLNIKGSETLGPPLWIFAEKMGLSYNPFSFIKGKAIDIWKIQIHGLKGRLLLSVAKELTELKSLFLIRDIQSGKNEKGRGWSVHIGRIMVDGKDVTIDFPVKQSYIIFGNFDITLRQLDRYAPYPVQMNFKDTECQWKGLYRFIHSGTFEGFLSKQGIDIKSSRVNFAAEEELRWTGNITKRTDGVFFDGSYSGSLFSDTLAHFLKPFRQMKGKVFSKGRIGGKWKQMKIEADLKAARFSWRKYDFKEVKGSFNYHAGLLEFKNMKGLWKNGHLEIESSIELRDRKAIVNILAHQVPSISLFQNWPKIFPKQSPLWEGHMEWKITWPQRIMKSDGILRMEAPFPTSENYPDEKLHIHSTFHSYKKQLFLDNIKMVISNNHLEAQGQYNTDQKSISLTYQCNIQEMDFVSKIWGFPFKGTGKINGIMTGLLLQPRLTGHMEGNTIKLWHYPLDRIVLDYDYQKDELKLVSIYGFLEDAIMKGHGWVLFSKSFKKPDLELLWSIDGLSLSEIASLRSYQLEFPYQGHISAEGNLKMARGELSSKGSFRGENMTFFGQLPINMEASFDSSFDRVTFQDIKVSREQDRITGELSYEKEKGLILKANTSGWQLYPIQFRDDRQIAIKGILGLNISGDLRDMAGQFDMKDLSFRNRGSLDVSGNIHLKDDKLQAFILHPWGKADYELDLEKDWLFRMSSTFESLSIFDPKTGLGDPNSAYSMIMDGDMEVQGLLKKGIKSIEGKFRGEDLIISGPIGTFVSKESFDLILKEKVIFTPSLRIEGEKGNLHIQGALDLSQGIDIHITGDIPLDILQNHIPDIKGLKGQTELGVKLTGTLSNPLFHGEIKLSEGGFLIPPYNLRMDNIQGIIQLANQSAYMNDITAETRGGGWIGLNGVVEYKNRAIHSFNLTADFDELYIYKQNAYKGFLEGQLEWFGNPDFSMLIGDVQVKEARHVAYKDIIQFLLAKKREIETDDLLEEGVKKNWGQWLEETNLSIGLDLGEEFWVRSPFYSATLTGHLMIKGPFTTPWLDGDIKVREGDIIIGSQRFSITSGIITLSNPTMNEPSINAVAYHDINSYRLRLSVFGPLNKPNLQFSSTPYLSQPEILNMVFFGLSTEEGQREGQESDIVSLMLSTTGRVLINVIGEDVSSYTGLDAMSLDFFPKDFFRLDIFNIQLEEEGGGVERLTLGKTLSKRLKIKYTRLKGEEQREIAEAEYMITDHLTLIGSQDDQGTYSLDLNIGLSF